MGHAVCFNYILNLLSQHLLKNIRPHYNLPLVPNGAAGDTLFLLLGMLKRDVKDEVPRPLGIRSPILSVLPPSSVAADPEPFFCLYDWRKSLLDR